MTVALLRFVCTKCGHAIEAHPAATVTHRCPSNRNRVTQLVAVT